LYNLYEYGCMDLMSKKEPRTSFIEGIVRQVLKTGVFQAILQINQLIPCDYHLTSLAI
jgi:hypothetical protein